MVGLADADRLAPGLSPFITEQNMDETFTVVAPFATRTRRFAAGSTITAADFDGQLTLERALEKKLVARPAAPKAAKASPAEAE